MEKDLLSTAGTERPGVTSKAVPCINEGNVGILLGKVLRVSILLSMLNVSPSSKKKKQEAQF